ncbi:hypothetical protein B0I35DRAFT_484111 [Stachybotrys elegans]|uniref:Chitin synthase regulatory factor 3 n=1 Tax=Stachybotrys elegans TaxID=80388 RepID=A0A8K0SG11_9HYPO|nr:hypothetical protein B0I35DRAFT_484111 [Stachybotrys elegans]
MAYDGGYGGGYGGQQRPYPGPQAQRPPPRGYDNGPPPQQYDNYQDGYGYDGYNDGYNDGYGQGYDDQYQDPGYGRGGPPQDQYGRGGGPMNYPPGPQRGDYGPPRGGGPMGPGAGRGLPSRPGPGRGAGRPPPQTHNSDPTYSHRGPPNQPTSPRQAGFGSQPFPGPDRRPPPNQDQAMADQMAGMDLNGPGSRGPLGRSSLDMQRGQGGYGQSPMNGRPPPTRQYPPQDYPDARQGPTAGGYADYGNNYDQARQAPPNHEFGPLARSRTMPVNEMPMRNDMPPPPPMPGAPGRGVPQRPSTATGNRPPPQRMYTQDPQQHGGYDAGQGYRQASRASIEDVYDSYQDNRMSNPEYGHAPPSRTSLPDFDSGPLPGGRGSFDQTRRLGPEQPQPGPRQTPMLNHTKSQPDLRQPQAAVFEMASDIPAVPPMPYIQPYQPGAEQGYGGPGGFDQIPRGPSAPPGPIHGQRAAQPEHPAIMRPGPAAPQARSADALPAHPTPVRPGLMADSMVNQGNKPPPVRNYGGVPYSGAPQQQQQQQQQQMMPQQQGPPPGGPPQPKKQEPPVTPQELEHLRMVIKNNPNDQESALRLAKRLVQASDVLVPNLPDPKARQRARERYLVDAHKILKKLANAQNPEAMFFMADSIGKGLFSHEPDNKEAFTLYQSAAKLGHAAAAYRTAVCCEIGHEEGGGTRKDPLKAMQWYKRAATLGDPPAMYKMGMILLKGLLGQPRNPREAIGWLKRAAERADVENPHALHELGLLYESAQPNDVIIRDERYALSLFQQAAELGYKFSQFRLGSAFEYGTLGCPVDPRQSIMWYSRAAALEEHQAELALSGWYLTGSEGVLGQSDTEAYLWARKAAVAGLAKAEYAMGYFTEVGIGTAANLEDAKRWYWRAAAQDFPKARDRLEDLKRAGRGGPARQRERISRSRMDRQQEGECSVM